MLEKLRECSLDQSEVIQACIDEANDEVSGGQTHMMGLLHRVNGSFLWDESFNFCMPGVVLDPSCCWWVQI